MSILRKESRRGYTHIDNALADAEGLSFRARGIALVLLSKPDDWVIKISYLMKIAKEGEQAIRTAMQELAAFGFLMRVRERDKQGHVRTVTMVADYPAFIDVGTPETRINGYASSVTGMVETDMAVSGMSEATDLAVSEDSVNRTSVNRQVGKHQVLVTPDLPTTDLPTTTEPTPETAAAQPGDLPKAKEKKSKPKAESQPNTKPIMDAYEERLGYDVPNYQKEVVAAKKLAKRGYTALDVVAAYEKVKSEDYWAERHLSLHTLVERIPALQQALLNGRTSQKSGSSYNSNLTMRSNGRTEERHNESDRDSDGFRPGEKEAILEKRRARERAAAEANATQPASTV